jgi:hypothetical protein
MEKKNIKLAFYIIYEKSIAMGMKRTPNWSKLKRVVRYYPNPNIRLMTKVKIKQKGNGL